MCVATINTCDDPSGSWSAVRNTRVPTPAHGVDTCPASMPAWCPFVTFFGARDTTSRPTCCLPLTKVPADCRQVVVEPSSVLFPILCGFLPQWDRSFVWHLNEFRWCANHRRIVPCGTAYRLNCTAQGRIGDVPAIPGHEVIDAVHRGYGNMHGVDGSLRRERNPGHERLGK